MLIQGDLLMENALHKVTIPRSPPERPYAQAWRHLGASCHNRPDMNALQGWTLGPLLLILVRVPHPIVNATAAHDWIKEGALQQKPSSI